jgi:hypothetical protein
MSAPRTTPNGHAARQPSPARVDTHTSESADAERQHVAQRLCESITIRVTESEKALIALLAERSELSVGRYIASACRAVGRRQLDRDQDQLSERRDQVIRDLEKEARRRRRKKPTPRRVPKPFKTPFLKEPHGQSFESVVSTVAEKMYATEHSVARLLSFFAEAVGDVVADGRVFRFPSFFIVAPCLTGSRSADHIVPRFQSYPPFNNHVMFNCPLHLGQNRALQAHRRRRRQRPSTLPQAMEAFRAQVEAQDRENLDGMEAWREFAE